MMIKVLLYAYCTGVMSSRRMAQALEGDVAFRYLAANQQPDSRTLSEFRKEHREALEGLFVEILRLCREAGLVKMGRLALDGRKVAGNAALDQNRTRAQLEKEIGTEVARLLGEAEACDREEDARYGAQTRGDELPAELRTTSGRLARLREAKARLEEREKEARAAQAEKIERRAEEEKRSGRRKRGRKPKAPEEVVDPEAKANRSDPESRILKMRRGWVQGYNAQAMADCTSQVIVAREVTQDENDVGQLAPMLACCEEQAGGRPEQLLADAGYWSEENAGREAYKQRGSTIEPVFGQMEMRTPLPLSAARQGEGAPGVVALVHDAQPAQALEGGNQVPEPGNGHSKVGKVAVRSPCDALTRRLKLRGASNLLPLCTMMGWAARIPTSAITNDQV
jgi:hypothetical protein